ncbi:hypothetical protein M758_UG310600 [Ceratodon purpureus]|nr:hypothetical protein M758_UG310600 [Ceratodon purpureus]
MFADCATWYRFVVNFSAEVAAHVPTRLKLQCVNHFIQLLFGDSNCDLVTAILLIGAAGVMADDEGNN